MDEIADFKEISEFEIDLKQIYSRIFWDFNDFVKDKFNGIKDLKDPRYLYKYGYSVLEDNHEEFILKHKEEQGYKYFLHK